MSSTSSRRAVAETDFSGSEFSSIKIGNRSIHGFWHLLAPHFRQVLVSPQRRPDNGRVAWTWSEALAAKPATAAELSDVRKRLSAAQRSLASSLAGDDGEEGDSGGGTATLEAHVLAIVGAVVGRLVAEKDASLARFVCRTETGLMVHSWGCSSPPAPQYPGVSAGKISGIIRAATGKPVVARVILVDKKGVEVAAVDSGRDGAFLFSNIAAGSYRLKAADRSDFPKDGMPVTLDRDSVTGLEFRGNGEASGEGGGANATAARPAGNRRRWAVAVVTLVMLGASGSAFFYLRSDDGRPAMNRLSGMWNSATGPGTASGGASLGRDGHGLGSGTRSPFPSKPETAVSSPFLRKDPADADSANPREGEPAKEMGVKSTTAPRAEKEPRSGMVMDKDKSPEGDRREPMAPLGGKPREATPSAPLSPSQGNPAIAEQGNAARGLAGTGPQGAADTKGGAAQAMPSSPPPASASGALPGSTAQSENRSVPPETARSAVMEKMRVVVPSPSGQTAAGGVATAPYSTGGNAESTVQGADAGGDGAAALDPSAAGGSSNGQSAGGKVQEGPGQAGGAVAGAASPAASDSYVAASVQAEVGASAKGASAAVKPPPKALPRNGNHSDNPLLHQDAQQVNASTAAKDAAADDEARGKAVDPSPEADVKQAAPRREATSAVAEGVPQPDDPDKAEAGTSSPHEAGSNGSVAAVAAPRKSRADPSLPDRGSIQAQAGATGAQGGVAGVPPSPKGTVALVRIGGVRASNWTPQVFKDTILPTQPEPASVGEAVETMRADLKKEKLSRLPDSLRHPLVRKGFAIEFPAGPAAPEWRNTDGIAASSEVRGNRAELTFLAGRPPTSSPIILAYKDGREIAQVSIGQDGTPVLNAAPGTRSWYWVGLVHPRADGTFNWQVSSGGPAPADWQSDDQWPGGPGQRIEIPVSPAGDRSNRYSVSLVDPSTGCGVTCAVTLE
jgi:hypothetical protein